MMGGGRERGGEIGLNWQAFPFLKLFINPKNFFISYNSVIKPTSFFDSIKNSFEKGGRYAQQRDCVQYLL